MIKDLIEIKFYNAGDWILENDILKHTCKNLPTNKNALYSFVVNNNVLYVGKTTNTLKKRLGQYETAHSSQKTNLKVHNNILDQLKEKQKVEIYIYINQEPEYVGRFELNVAAGLEDSIISTLKPKWNNTGKKEIGEESITPLEETKEQIILANYAAYKTLQKIGYSKARICEELYLTEEELLDLKTNYHDLTGK